MNVKFPQQENPFPKTMATAVLSCLVALAIGLFLGNALGALFGTDETVINTSTYSDYMAAARTLFTDADQLDSYAVTALTLQDMDGLKLYTSRGRDKVVAYWQGQYVDAFTLFDDEVRLSLLALMNTGEALYGLETTGGTPIEDLYLRNVAVTDGVVYYYLYYDEAGYIGIAYDSTGEILAEDPDHALPLTKTKSGTYEWFITYQLEE